MNLPADNQIAVLVRALPVLFKPGKLWKVGENRLHKGGFCAGADEIPAGALADHRADGIDHDRLSRAGFAGKCIKAGVKPDIRRFNDRNIFNMKQREHSNHPPSGGTYFSIL